MTYDPKEMHAHHYELSSGGGGGTWLIAAGMIILLVMGILTILGGFPENEPVVRDVTPLNSEAPGIIPADQTISPATD